MSNETRILFHGSHEILTKIKGGQEHDFVTFGGIFASSSRSVAESHGPIVHVIEVPESKIADTADFKYRHNNAPSVLRKASLKPRLRGKRFERLWELVVEQADVDGSTGSLDHDLLQHISASICGSDLGWAVQFVRGRMAGLLGYQAVTVLDEHGISYLILPETNIRLAYDDEY